MTFAPDIDDLLGAVPQKRPPGRPRKDGRPAGSVEKPPTLRDLRKAAQAEPAPPPPEPQAEESLVGPINSSALLQALLRPVSPTFLADVFRIDRRTALKKLAACPVVGHEGGGRPVYDFVQAAGYLVKPQVDIGTWIKSQRVQDLPPHLAPGIAQAMLHRQTWEQRAGDLWRTEDVQSVFGDVFMLLRDTMKLWVETLNDRHSLTSEQWETLNQSVHGLQDDLHHRLVELPGLRRTPNSRERAEMDMATVEAVALEET